MSDLGDLIEQGRRLAAMRADVHRQVNELFAALSDMAEGDQVGSLIRVASNFERERDQARERVAELESEVRALRRDSVVTVDQRHVAMLRDAALTLRNAMKGVTDMPITDPSSARVIGQVNKAVVAFDDATAGMLGV